MQAIWPQAQPIYAYPGALTPGMQAAYQTPGIFAPPHLQNARVTSLGQDSGTGMQVASVVWSLLSLAGAVSGAYHGYKRNDSVGWAIGWGLLGGIFPVITIPVSLAQGYGQPHK